MEKLNLDKKNLRKFGIMMGVAFLVISLLLILRHKYNGFSTIIFSAIFFIFGFSFPSFLKPIYIIWMRFAFMLGWINTRLILFMIFYLIFTPMGLVIKLFGIDLLDRRIKKDKESYWVKKEQQKFASINYERQF